MKIFINKIVQIPVPVLDAFFHYLGRKIIMYEQIPDVTIMMECFYCRILPW